MYDHGYVSIFTRLYLLNFVLPERRKIGGEEYVFVITMGKGNLGERKGNMGKKKDTVVVTEYRTILLRVSVS